MVLLSGDHSIILRLIGSSLPQSLVPSTQSYLEDNVLVWLVLLVPPLALVIKSPIILSQTRAETFGELTLDIGW